MSDPRFDWLTIDHEPCGPGEKPARFGFTCPNKGHQCEGLILRPGPFTQMDTPQPPQKTWEWDGNREAPTIYPSINCGGCGWHGWIRQGKLVKA